MARSRLLSGASPLVAKLLLSARTRCLLLTILGSWGGGEASRQSWGTHLPVHGAYALGGVDEYLSAPVVTMVGASLSVGRSWLNAWHLACCFVGSSPCLPRAATCGALRGVRRLFRHLWTRAVAGDRSQVCKCIDIHALPAQGVALSTAGAHAVVQRLTSSEHQDKCITTISTPGLLYIVYRWVSGMPSTATRRESVPRATLWCVPHNLQKGILQAPQPAVTS